MKTNDIDIARTYVAKLDYGSRAQVEVLEVGIERDHGHRNRQIRRDGVKVRVLLDLGAKNYEVHSRVGEELVVPSIQIERAWTKADEDGRAADAQMRKRVDRVREFLTQRGYGVTEGRFADADVKVNRFSGNVTLTIDAAERLLEL